jgi:hypothetical protein
MIVIQRSSPGMDEAAQTRRLVGSNPRISKTVLFMIES